MTVLVFILILCTFALGYRVFYTRITAYGEMTRRLKTLRKYNTAFDDADIDFGLIYNSRQTGWK